MKSIIFCSLFLFCVTTIQAVLIEVSFGELVDKITILEIKLERIEDEQKRSNVMTEYELLSDVYKDLCALIACPQELADLHAMLRKINEQLWDVEDRIRDKERARVFDAEFVTLARLVYMTNDERCHLKREINELLGSRIIEEKSYSAY